MVASKYTLRLTTGNARDANLGGNSRKSMHRSVENSLRRLSTDYLDLLYLHMWDYVTPVDEVLRAVDDLIRVGRRRSGGQGGRRGWMLTRAGSDQLGAPATRQHHPHHGMSQRGTGR